MQNFQISFGDCALFAHKESLSIGEIKQLVTMLGEDLRLFGDIYASKPPLKRL